MADGKHNNFPWWVVTTAAGVAATAFVFTNFITPYQNQKIEQLQERMSIVSHELSEAKKEYNSQKEKNKLFKNRIGKLSKSLKIATDSIPKDYDKIKFENMELSMENSNLRTDNKQISQKLSNTKKQLEILKILQDLTESKLKQCERR